MKKYLIFFILSIFFSSETVFAALQTIDSIREPFSKLWNPISNIYVLQNTNLSFDYYYENLSFISDETPASVLRNNPYSYCTIPYLLGTCMNGAFAIIYIDGVKVYDPLDSTRLEYHDYTKKSINLSSFHNKIISSGIKIEAHFVAYTMLQNYPFSPVFYTSTFNIASGSVDAWILGTYVDLKLVQTLDITGPPPAPICDGSLTIYGVNHNCVCVPPQVVKIENVYNLSCTRPSDGWDFFGPSPDANGMCTWGTEYYPAIQGFLQYSTRSCVDPVLAPTVKIWFE